MQSMKISLLLAFAFALSGTVGAQESKPAGTASATAAKTAKPAGEAPKAAKKAAAKTNKPAPVDINSASAEQLRTVLGITEVQAEKIVKNRPFPTRAHLVTKEVMTYDEYVAIKDRLIAYPVGAAPGPAKTKK